jgi:hypothetical protein
MARKNGVVSTSHGTEWLSSWWDLAVDSTSPATQATESRKAPRRGSRTPPTHRAGR